MSGVHPSIVGTPQLQGATHWLWPNEFSTRTFANALAQQVELQNAYIELVGDLGAGKTTFVRHLLQALGVEGRIKSPTYAVVEPHEGRHPLSHLPLAIWHFDFYRFNDPQEFEEAGFRDLFASPGLKIAEWPNQAQGMLPSPDLQFMLAVDGQEARHVQVLASSTQGQYMLQGISLILPPMASDHANSAT